MLDTLEFRNSRISRIAKHLLILFIAFLQFFWIVEDFWILWSFGIPRITNFSSDFLDFL